MSNEARPLYDQLARIRSQFQTQVVSRPIMQITTASVGNATLSAALRFQATQDLVLRWMNDKHRTILGG